MDNHKSSHVEVSDKSLEIKTILKPYIRKWYWFIISFIFTLTIGYVSLKFMTPIFNIHSTILIKDSKAGSSNSEINVLQDLSGFGGMKTNSVDNEIEILKSKKLMREVVSSENLQADIFVKGKIITTELYKETSPIVIRVLQEKRVEKLPEHLFDLKIEGNKLIVSSDELKKEIVSEFDRTISLPHANIIISKNKRFDPSLVNKIDLKNLKFSITPLENKVAAFQGALNVGLVNKDATVVTLSLNNPQISKAIDIIKSLVVAYNKDAILDKNSESRKTLDFIDDRIRKLSIELGDVENEKENFKSKIS